MKKMHFSVWVGLLLFVGMCSATIVYPPVKYGQQVTVYFSIYDSNSPWQYYETAPAADDVYVRKDGGAAARATNAVTDLDHTMSLVLTAAEMQAAIVTVDINDETSPAVYGSETIIIPTFGNASALQEFDLDVSSATLVSNMAAAILADPNYPMWTNADGYVGVGTMGTDVLTSDAVAESAATEIGAGVGSGMGETVMPDSPTYGTYEWYWWMAAQSF